ncbi:MAG: alpha/beta hydrolase [Gammaproteobacteria bacterium]|nr:alpha/beta hydrolase [Gammaproteobacteria bacterium]
MSGDGEPLLLIHGLGSSTRDWELQVPAFSAQYKVIVIDLRGHGRSDKPTGPYSIPLFAADTARLMEALNIRAAHIVGLSLGGMVAFQLAVSWPALVRSLVVVNSGPEFVVSTPRERFLLWERKLLVRWMGMKRFGKFLGRRLFPKPGQERLRRRLAETMAENDPRAYREALRAMTAGWSVERHLKDLHCPTLVIAATGDYTPVAYKAAYVAMLPKAELLVIRDSRHATPADQPAEFNKAVLAFVARHPSL